MLLAEVAPISSTQSGSSDLKMRESSAMALERRVSRSWDFGAGDDSGALRKNLIQLRADPAGDWTFNATVAKTHYVPRWLMLNITCQGVGGPDYLLCSI